MVVIGLYLKRQMCSDCKCWELIYYFLCHFLNNFKCVYTVHGIYHLQNIKVNCKLLYYLLFRLCIHSQNDIVFALIITLTWFSTLFPISEMLLPHTLQQS